MATPVAHSLIGLALGKGRRGTAAGRAGWRWYLFAIASANAADLDFVPGLLVGDINRYHQSLTHTLIAAMLFGLLVAVFASRAKPRLRPGPMGAALYASHLVLDFFTSDVRAPHGLPLLWPFWSGHLMSPWTPLGGVRHANPGDSLSLFFAEVFSWHNLKVAALEIMLFMPMVGLAWYLARRRARRESVGEP